MTGVEKLRSIGFRRVLFGVWWVVLPIAAFLYLQPIGSRPIRGAIAGLLVLLWAVGLTLWWWLLDQAVAEYLLPHQ